jgi:RecB family exonuclease
MQEVWKALGQDQAQLLALSESALETRVQDAVARVLDRFADAGKIELGPGFRANEQVAIVGRVLGAMTLDRLRTTPFVVEEMERKRTGRIGPLTVKLQMDRVDRLADGRRVLVDYKTGKASPSTWEGERPKDLQLPIYAGLLENVGGLFFVQVREEEQAYLGSQADASVTNGLPAKKGRTLRIETPEDWSGQLARWGEVARKLAQDFVDGEAAVDPLESRSGETCQYCGLQSFCRVVPGGGQGV